MMNNRQHSYTEALLILLIPTMMLHIYHPYLFPPMSYYLGGLISGHTQIPRNALHVTRDASESRTSCAGCSTSTTTN